MSRYSRYSKYLNYLNYSNYSKYLNYRNTRMTEPYRGTSDIENIDDTSSVNLYKMFIALSIAAIIFTNKKL